MNLNGHYVRLSKAGMGAGIPSSWIIPYNGEVTLGTQQQTIQPIKLAFEELKDAIFEEANLFDSTISVVAKAGLNLLDFLGIKLFSKGYYALAWDGEEPAEISLKLDFFVGMMGLWSAISEVYDPIMSIMAITVPFDGLNADIITAPMPSPLGVFVHFATDIVTQALSGSTNPVVATVIAPIQGEVNNISTSAQATQKNALSTNSMLWSIEFGWGSGSSGSSNSQNFNPYVLFNNLACTASSFSFSPTLQKSLIGGLYPVKGTLNLTFKSQDIITYSDFYKNFRRPS